MAARWLTVVIAALAMVATLPGRTFGLGLITVPLLRDLDLGEQQYAALNSVATLLGNNAKATDAYSAIRRAVISGEISRRLRADPLRADLPVVAVSGFGEESRNASRDAGFDAYLAKPVDASTLVTLIQNTLRARRKAS